MHRLAAVFAASVVWFLATGFVLAQSVPAPSPDFAPPNAAENKPPNISTSSPAPGAGPLNETGTWDLSVWAREAVGNSAYGDVGDAYASMGGFRAGYVFARPPIRGPLRGTLEYFFDVIPVFILTKPQTIYGGGLSPVGLKWNFVDRRYQPYVDVSLGGILSTRDVPPGNTSNFNFTVAADGGMTIVSDQRHALTANLGFWHFSNAHIGNTNPSLNALTFGIEYHWFKAK